MPDIRNLARGVRQGHRRALAQAITLVESTLRAHRQQAIELLQTLTPFAGGSRRIGISGVPGVGKSTFIDVLGKIILSDSHRLAVLSIDPSSSLSGGSILGDKTRMPYLAHHARAFVRPSPAGLTLGGVARRTRESIVLCEAAGYDYVLVETVGVGQSETAVADMTDLFVLMLLPGGGDELQGMKRGIVERADIIIVNKADGGFCDIANHTAADYRHALSLAHHRSGFWSPEVRTCSALSKKEVQQSLQTFDRYFEALKQRGEGSKRRQQQALIWFREDAKCELLDALQANRDMAKQLHKLEQEIVAGKKLPSVAALELVSRFITNTSSS